ncbi:hypothetical protein ABGB14_14495 [Nonomuraea sp. B10E15]|uniref:hypothetical protein n=1 Tax=Nonomuraea sp. B10E15 TaxID=3153560 RepID=UPI00325DDDEC
MTSIHVDAGAIDLDEPGAWMDDQGPPPVPITGATPVPGGAARHAGARPRAGGRAGAGVLPRDSSASRRERPLVPLARGWPAGDDHVPGLPAPQEIIASYAALSERDMSAIDWYAVTLGLFERAQELKGGTLN